MKDTLPLKILVCNKQAVLPLFSSACVSGTILDAVYTEETKQNPYTHRTYTVVVVGEENFHLNFKIKYIMICVSSFYVK